VAKVSVPLVPEHATEEHLQLLSELAQMFSDKPFREDIAAATSTAELHALFSNWETDNP
jgi:nitrogen PTS system EIIA component